MARKPKPPVKKNDEFIGTVMDMSYQGFGVLKFEGFTVFVPDAIPGEELKVGITKVAPHFAYGRVIERLKASPNRVDGEHQQLINSGIAPLINLKYEAQLTLKQTQIEQLFKKVGLSVDVALTIGMADPTHYRNKTVVPIQNQDGKLVTGFYRRGSHKLVPIDDYYLNDPVIDQAIGQVRDILNEFKIKAWEDESKSGSIRYVMVRRGYYSHEMMIVLVSAKKHLPNEDAIVEALKKAFGEQLNSLVLNYNPRQTNVLLGTKNRTLAGAPVIHDQLLNQTFVIGPNSFYQVNPQTTEVLYDMAADKADLKPNDLVIDAYSGIGTIGLSVANRVKEVIGVEVVEQAVADAQLNVAANEIENATFIAADAPKQMVAWRAEGVKPDVVFVDPPRRGLTPELIDAVTDAEVGMLPETFVYISCNPATLARDAVQLIENGYHIEGPIQPIDQFPQTTHIESITIFKR